MMTKVSALFEAEAANQPAWEFSDVAGTVGTRAARKENPEEKWDQSSGLGNHNNEREKRSRLRERPQQGQRRQKN